MRLATLLLVLAVILPRAAAVAAISDHYFERGDLNWDLMARAVVEGDALHIPKVGMTSIPGYAHKTPVFALVLAGIYATAGRVVWAVAAVQILFALLATLAVYHLGRRITGSRGTALLAAWITALYPVLFVHDVQLMETTIYRGLVAVLLLCLLSVADDPRPRMLLLTGVVAGLTVLTRSTILLFLPLAALWLLFRWRPGALRVVPRALLGVLAFLAVLSPWLVRNAELLGGIHVVTGGGRSFWIGSGEPFLAMFPEKSVDRAETARFFALPRPERLKLRMLDEVGLDRELWRRAREDLAAHPERILPLAWLKTKAAFSWFVNPVESGDAVTSRWAGVRSWVYTLTYGPLAVLGALGLLLLLARRPPEGSLLLLLGLSFWAFSVLFWAHSRHRFFLDEFLAVTAAYLVVTVLTRGPVWGDRHEEGAPSRATPG